MRTREPKWKRQGRELLEKTVRAAQWHATAAIHAEHEARQRLAVWERVARGRISQRVAANRGIRRNPAFTKLLDKNEGGLFLIWGGPDFAPATGTWTKKLGWLWDATGPITHVALVKPARQKS